MLKSLTLAVALGAMTALFAGGASALPAAPATTQAAQNDVTLVRDGCGRGQRFSNSRGRCVDQDRGRGFRGRDRDFRRDRGRSFRDECRRGWRFSNRRNRCVRNHGARQGGDDDAAAVAVGAIINAIGSNGNKAQHRNKRQRPGADGQED